MIHVEGFKVESLRAMRFTIEPNGSKSRQGVGFWVQGAGIRVGVRRVGCNGFCFRGWDVGLRV